MARRDRPPSPDWPHWFYGPNGESAIFNSATEVPYGWVKKPGLAFEPPPATEILNKDELVAKLIERGIKIDPTWGNAHMKRMLDD